MIAPLFNNTILILNTSLLRYNVPLDIKTINTSELLKLSREEIIKIYSSPVGLKITVTGDYRPIYLSNGIVTWINSNTEDFVAAHSGMEWDDDIKMLKSRGLKFGKDMVMIQFDDYRFYTVDENHYPVKCNWTKFILKDFNRTYLWVGEGSKFNCNSILGFKS